MEQVTYCILRHQGDWQILSNGDYFGPHKTPDAAIRIAVSAAKRAKKDGQAALVLLQNREGSLQTIWQYENSGYFTQSFAF